MGCFSYCLLYVGYLWCADLAYDVVLVCGVFAAGVGGAWWFWVLITVWVVCWSAALDG